MRSKVSVAIAVLLTLSGCGGSAPPRQTIVLILPQGTAQQPALSVDPRSPGAGCVPISSDVYDCTNKGGGTQR